MTAMAKEIPMLDLSRFESVEQAMSDVDAAGGAYKKVAYTVSKSEA
jgi:hypothetical protein